MPILAPIATNRILAGKSRTVLFHRIINVHTMVGTLEGTESYFAPSGRPYSHFGVGGAGEIWQWQYLDYRAASDLDGNPFSISIETEDKGSGFPAWSGSDVPRWTPAQAEALAQTIAWLCVRFNITPILLKDSLPGRVGPSYHRLGINPWRVTGGILYSSAYGKACPGDRRILQLRDEVMPRVRTLLNVTPPPSLKDRDKMYAFIRGDNWPAIYLTDNMTKRHMVDDAELTGYRNLLQASGAILWKNGEVDVWPGALVDRIPTVQPEDQNAQLIDFVNAPDGNGVFLVFASSMKLRFPNTPEGNASLSDHQNHWAARGFDTSVKSWSPNDVDIIPELVAPPADEEPPPLA